jgi:SAM-dependent methyltransferase
LSIWTRSPQTPGVDVDAYETLAEMESHYWWHVGRLRILDAQLRRLAGAGRPHILNVGCGTGGTVGMLERHGTVVNVDVSDQAIAHMARLGYDDVVKVDGIELPFEDATFDLVAAFDVLEHIEKDATALVEWARVLRPGGRILLTVPAHQWLWSGFDVAQHHHRRYNRRTLRAAVLQAGLTPRRISYAIAFSLPLVAGFRLLAEARNRPPEDQTGYVRVPRPVNRAFIGMLALEARMHHVMRVPFGTSVLAELSH